MSKKETQKEFEGEMQTEEQAPEDEGDTVGNGATDAEPKQREGQADNQEEKVISISESEYERLKNLAAERDDYLERLKRAVANTMSLQKRIEKVRENADREALRQVACKVVPLADSLGRARENAENTGGAEQIAEGIGMTEKEFYDMLAELDIHPIKALGEPFNPSYHEAVMQEPRGDHEPNTVVRELKKGFMLGDSLLRPAQVVVSTSLSDDAKEGKSEREE